MANRAIPMIAFPWVQCMFMYIYLFVAHTQLHVCIVYVVKEVESFQETQLINGRGA